MDTDPQTGNTLNVRPLKSEDYMKLIKQFIQLQPEGVMNFYNLENVLKINNIGKTSVYFKIEKGKREVIVGGTKYEIFFPSMIWAYNGKSMKLFAVREIKGQPEYHYMKWFNVNGTGDLCLGNVKYPRMQEDLEGLRQKLLVSFFQNQFSNELIRLLPTDKKTVLQELKEHKKKKKTYFLSTRIFKSGFPTKLKA